MARGNQLTRQWGLLQILQSHRFGIAIDDLTYRTGCSRRTIERDLNILNNVGFPIISETRDYGKKFWRLEQKFLSSDKLLAESTEIVGLYLAQQYLSSLKITPYTEGIKSLWNKIGKLLPSSALNYFSELEDSIYLKHTFGTPSFDTGLFSIIRTATNSKIVLDIEYNSPQKGSVNMKFHPYGIVLLDNSAYVIGFAEYAKNERTLKIQRIKNAKLTKKKFNVPEGFSLQKRLKGSFGIVYSKEKPTTVRCKFTGFTAQRIREQKWHPSQVIEEDNGETLLASFLLSNTNEFTSWVLRFGSDVCVIEPAILKQQVIARLKKTLENYEK